MIKNGVLQLKKLSIIFAVLITLVLFSGCNSLPDETSLTTVKPQDLLDASNTLYVSIPSSVDPDFVYNMIQKSVTNISPEDAKTLSDKIDRVYAGIIKTRNSTQIQAAINSRMPVKFIPKVLNIKNGWQTKDIECKEPFGKYKVYSQQNIDLSFPSSNISLLGRGMDFMLNKYNYIYNLPENTEVKFYSYRDDIYEWITETDKEIRFFTVAPKTYLGILTGDNLDLSLVDVKGSIRKDPDYETAYLLDIHFNFKSEIKKKAGTALLKIAFGISNAYVEEVPDNPCAVIFRNIQLPKERIYKLINF